MDSVESTELLLRLRRYAEEVEAINDCPDLDATVELSSIALAAAKDFRALDIGLSSGGEFPNMWRIAGGVESALREKVNKALETLARGVVEVSELLELKWVAKDTKTPTETKKDDPPRKAPDYGF